MKRLLFILSILVPSLLAAQEKFADTTTIFFDEALAWIDTTDCQSDTLITELPDSIYKIRLQALPLIIEVPYNEVVRKYILR